MDCCFVFNGLKNRLSICDLFCIFVCIMFLFLSDKTCYIGIDLVNLSARITKGCTRDGTTVYGGLLITQNHKR